MVALDVPRHSANEVAHKLGVHPETVRVWVKHGVGGVKLRALRIGGRISIRESDLEEFLLRDPFSASA